MKKSITLLVLLVLFAFGLSAIPNNINFSLKLRREVDEDTLLYFFSSDASGETSITVKELDTTVGLSVPQIYIYGTTNWKSPYLIVLVFTKMASTSDSTEKYPFTARILTNPNNTSEYVDAVFPAGSDEAQVGFNGGNTSNYGVEASFCYPVSFAFEELPAGSFSGTVRLEVMPE